MENVTTKKTKDFIIATGKSYSIKDFINEVAKYLDLKVFGKVKVLMKN